MEFTVDLLGRLTHVPITEMIYIFYVKEEKKGKAASCVFLLKPGK